MTSTLLYGSTSIMENQYPSQSPLCSSTTLNVISDGYWSNSVLYPLRLSTEALNVQNRPIQTLSSSRTQIRQYSTTQYHPELPKYPSQTLNSVISPFRPFSPKHRAHKYPKMDHPYRVSGIQQYLEHIHLASTLLYGSTPIQEHP